MIQVSEFRNEDIKSDLEDFYNETDPMNNKDINHNRTFWGIFIITFLFIPLYSYDRNKALINSIHESNYTEYIAFLLMIFAFSYSCIVAFFGNKYLNKKYAKAYSKIIHGKYHYLFNKNIKTELHKLLFINRIKSSKYYDHLEDISSLYQESFLKKEKLSIYSFINGNQLFTSIFISGIFFNFYGQYFKKLFENIFVLIFVVVTFEIIVLFNTSPKSKIYKQKIISYFLQEAIFDKKGSVIFENKQHRYGLD